jgi:hypothetical protein
MRGLETRSQGRGGNRALAGRKIAEQPDDNEALTIRQAGRLSLVHPISLEVALTLARLAYARGAS